jgi:hypothetical protein
MSELEQIKSLIVISEEEPLAAFRRLSPTIL